MGEVEYHNSSYLAAIHEQLGAAVYQVSSHKQTQGNKALIPAY